MHMYSSIPNSQLAWVRCEPKKLEDRQAPSVAVLPLLVYVRPTILFQLCVITRLTVFAYLDDTRARGGFELWEPVITRQTIADACNISVTKYPRHVFIKSRQLNLIDRSGSLFLRAYMHSITTHVMHLSHLDRRLYTEKVGTTLFHSFIVEFVYSPIPTPSPSSSTNVIPDTTHNPTFEQRKPANNVSARPIHQTHLHTSPLSSDVTNNLPNRSNTKPTGRMHLPGHCVISGAPTTDSYPFTKPKDARGRSVAHGIRTTLYPNRTI
jgi:hypothetical protein